LFQDPVSTVLLDRKGTFLGARIAADGQWRFPALDTVPARFAQCLITFEDKRFYYHPGIDPIALVRAISQNIRGRDVISGGSTITMQVIRLARKGKARTIWEKLVEMFLATRLDAGWRKADILALYASHAPFGGNVVGLEAAAWKYYGRSPDQLSWAEAATLAVLPNAPGLINPGKNRDLLLAKRNRLLSRLLADGTVDSTTYQTSLLEDLPGEPLALPSWAPHLLEQVHRDRPQGARQARVVSTLNASLQQRATEALTRYHTLLSQNGIDNMAAVIAEVGTGDVVAYVGNAPCESAGQGCEVDIIQAPRSTGSILKPFLYAAMLDNGELLPDMLWPDIPSYYAGFTPANYDRTYSGAIPAHQALARSLNVPIVRMLQYHGIPRFYGQLKRLGMTTLFRPADDYGLTLVLGGAEGTLWEVAGMYAGMMRTAAFFQTYNGRYDPAAFRPLNYLQRRSTGPL
jgi:penicillin-binding protein 1C